MANIYALRAIKMAGGDETPRFEAKITENGKVIGIVFNEGCGGSCGYHMSGDAKAFEAFIAEWGKQNNETSEVSDIWVYEQLDNWEERKLLMRRSNTMTPFRVKGDPKNEWRMWRLPYSEQVKNAIVSKYGDKVETIFVR